MIAGVIEGIASAGASLVIVAFQSAFCKMIGCSQSCIKIDLVAKRIEVPQRKERSNVVADGMAVAPEKFGSEAGGGT